MATFVCSHTDDVNKSFAFYKGDEEDMAQTDSTQRSSVVADVRKARTVSSSWFFCLLPDTTAVDDVFETPTLLTRDDAEEDRNSDSAAAETNREGRDETKNLIEENIDDDGSSFGISPEDCSKRIAQISPKQGQSEGSRTEGLPDTLFSAGSFESISGLSMQSYGTTASAMLGGLDYDEKDEQVISNVLGGKDDESVIEEDDHETPFTSAEFDCEAPRTRPTPLPATCVTAEIENRRERNLNTPTLFDIDSASNLAESSDLRSPSTYGGDTSCHDDSPMISEEGSICSVMRRDRERESIQVCEIKLKLKGRAVSDKERKHILELQSAIISFGVQDINVAHTLVTTGDFYASLSNFDRALSLHEEASSIYSAKLGDHDFRSIDSKVKIANMKLKVGRVDEAMETFCQVMYMRSALLGDDHMSVGEIRMRIAEIQRGKGHVKEAAKEVKKALKGYREVHGDDHPVVADAVECIAELYTEMGENEKANLIFSEIVKLRAAIDGQESSAVAQALIKWSWSFEAMGNTSRALKLMKQAYAALVKREGIAGAMTAEALEGVGKIYASMGRKDKAIKAYTRVLNIRRQALGEDHPTTAATFVTIGTALQEVGQSDKSMKCVKRAMGIYSDYCKKNSTENKRENEFDSAVSDSLHQIGLTFENLGENSQALKAFSREMSLRKEAHYTNKIRTARVLNAIGIIQCKLGKFQNAMEFFTEALANMDSSGGRNATFAATLFNVGLALEKMGEIDQAYQAYAETIVMYKVQGLGEGNPLVDNVINKINKNPDAEVNINLDGYEFGKLPCSILDNKSKFEC